MMSEVAHHQENEVAKCGTVAVRSSNLESRSCWNKKTVLRLSILDYAFPVVYDVTLDNQ
jgi:hypothetical protein